MPPPNITELKKCIKFKIEPEPTNVLKTTTPPKIDNVPDTYDLNSMRVLTYAEVKKFRKLFEESLKEKK
jgi:hypothetical protein